MNVPTPHIAAKEGEIAPSILLPGDPLRAKFIAENFLAGARQFNATRNMLELPITSSWISCISEGR